MDPLRFLAETKGFFTRPMAADFGYNSRSFDRVVRTGAWFRFRHGYYTFPDLWAVMPAAEQHRVRCRAVVHSLGPVVALSHISSLVMQDIDPWGQDLSRVHVTRLDGGAGRIEGDVVHHRARVTPAQLIEHDGLLMTPADRAVLEAACRRGGEAALCLMNQTLHAELVTPVQLWSAFRVMQAWPGMLGVHVPIRMANQLVASVGESRGFWLFRTHLLPAPQPQFEVWSGDTLLGTCDWGWPEYNLLGEFDGRIKYGRLLEPGMEPGAVVRAEKDREDAIREATDMRMVRLTWSDYDRPRLTARRVDRLLRRAA